MPHPHARFFKINKKNAFLTANRLRIEKNTLHLPDRKTANN